jgi:general secretion pathway protein M
VLAAGYLLIVAPLLDMYSDGQRALAEKRMLAQRLEANAATLPELQAQLAELTARANTREIMLEGNSDAIAGANLQSRLGKLASSTGVTIGSTEAVPPENRGVYRRIGLRLAVNGEYAAIVKLLGAVDQAAPPLVLANLQIHAMMRPMRGGDPSTSGRIDAGFEVYGFRSAEPPSPPKASISAPQPERNSLEAEPTRP